MSSNHDAFGSDVLPDDDPEGVQAEADAEQDERAQFPERFETGQVFCGDCWQRIDPHEDHECAQMRRANRRLRR